MKLILKGFIIGIGKIIPGVSGALLAISLGVYEPAIKAIGNFFKDPIKNFKFLFPLGVGAVLAIILTSKFLLFLLNNYYVLVMLFFLGLIGGGILPVLKKVNIKNLKISNYVVIFLTFMFVISLTFFKNNFSINDISNSFLEMLIYFLIGSIDAATMIIPGISGTAVMMLLGVYDLLLNLLSSINDVFNNLNIYIPYTIGIIITVLTLSKLISYLFYKKSELMYSGILGFSISSILVLLIDLFKNCDIKIYQIILFIIGIYISSKLEKIK